MKTIEEVLEPYKKHEHFYNSYLDCEPIDNVECCVFEDAEYCGYSLTTKSGKKYFTPYGIRGFERGTYFIYQNEPIKVVNIYK